ncbi:hybrid sensor histidine kinase/response regulator [Alcanivorax sp. 1008]|uniref:hybrid sensor histidine kinase/response regulator n=1 Tax=Alcanivorax sp. 1008 TaxID=2816853 RepID=UPI001DAB83CE|nr:hybrid sensor histidine kinase/response regulator [Alcanivorax sp. 1008]MCC1495512.1 response regulator [Alcanivorax sp. 1008]
MDTGSGVCGRRYSGIMAALYALLLCSSVNAAEIIALSDQDQQVRPTSGQQEVLCLPADQTPAASELLSETSQWPWQPATQRTVNRGFTNQTCWLRLQIDGRQLDQSDWSLVINYPLLNNVNLFIRKDDALLQTFTAGLSQPFDQRPVLRRKPTFPLDLDRNGITTILMSIQSDHSIQVPLRLWRNDALQSWQANSDQLQALFYGAMLVMMAYHFFLFLSVREPVYLYYVGWTASLTLLQAALQGHAQQYLWPTIGWLGGHVLTLLLPLIVLIGSRFTISFLELPDRRASLANLLRMHGHIAVALVLLVPFVPTVWLLPLDMLLILSFDLSVLFVASQRLFDRDPDARYFATAWICLLSGGLLITLNKFGIISRTPLTENLLQIGTVLDVMLLSMALAARINRLKADQLEAQRLRTEMEVLRAGSRSQAKNEFLVTMSHHIRTPMQGILGIADLLRHSDVSTERQRQYAGTIYNSTHSLIGVLNDLLDHSRIETGRLSLTPGEVRPEELVSDVIGLFISAAAEKKLPIYSYIDSRVPALIITDAVRVKQILTNLISNAIRSTDTGQISVSISLRQPADAVGNLVLDCDVTDTGIGLDAAQCVTIMSDAPERNGLGLSVSRKLCQLLGGELRVTSSPGHGASFHFTLPCRLASQSVDNGSLPGKRLLAVTESRALRLSVCQLAERWGMVAEESSTSDISSWLDTDNTSVDVLIVDQRSYLALTCLRQTPFAHCPWIVLAERHHNLIASTPANRPIVELPLESRRLRSTLNNLLGDSENYSTSSNESGHSTAQSLPTKVLVVDDDAVSQMVIGSILESLSVPSTIVSDGFSAAATVAPAKPHWQVIFMDCEMPGMNGYEATRAIRQQEQEQGRKPCWIIALSAHAGADAIKQAEQSGMNDYLCKPVTRDQMRQALARARWSDQD